MGRRTRAPCCWGALTLSTTGVAGEKATGVTTASMPHSWVLNTAIGPKRGGQVNFGEDEPDTECHRDCPKREPRSTSREVGFDLSQRLCSPEVDITMQGEHLSAEGALPSRGEHAAFEAQLSSRRTGCVRHTD